MKIVLDRRTCTCWQPSCEAHFSTHFLGKEITPIECLINMQEDGQPELTFFIMDRDGVDKTLVVDESNRPDAVDSWRELWEKQQGARN